MEEVRALTTLSDLDLELVALITETLCVESFLDFTSTCKAFRELAKEEVILKCFSGQSLLSTLVIAFKIQRVTLNLKDNKLRAMLRTFRQLEDIRYTEEVLVIRDSYREGEDSSTSEYTSAYKELISRGYTPSKYEINATVKYIADKVDTRKVSREHIIDSLEPRAGLGLVSLSGNSPGLWMALDASNPVWTLRNYLLCTVPGTYDLIGPIAEDLHSNKLENSSFTLCRDFSRAYIHRTANLVLMYKTKLNPETEKGFKKCCKFLAEKREDMLAINSLTEINRVIQPTPVNTIAIPRQYNLLSDF